MAAPPTGHDSHEPAGKPRRAAIPALTLPEIMADFDGLPRFEGQALPRLYRLAGWRAGFWVQRSTWGHTAAQVLTVNGRARGALRLRNPDRVPGPVIADVYDIRSGELLEHRKALPRPNAWEWTWVGVPAGWHALGMEECLRRTATPAMQRREAEALGVRLAVLAAPVVRLTRGTRGHGAALRRLGLRRERGAWLIPDERLAEVLALLNSSEATAQARAQQAARVL